MLVAMRSLKLFLLLVFALGWSVNSTPVFDETTWNAAIIAANGNPLNFIVLQSSLTLTASSQTITSGATILGNNFVINGGNFGTFF